jgi:hypothetical protein
MTRHILIYGDSIFLAGLAEQVRTLPGVQVEVRHSLTGLGDLAAFDAVIVDLDNPATADVLTLLRARPDLKVIGVNQATGALTVLAGQVYLAHSLDDVIVHLEQPVP